MMNGSRLLAGCYNYRPDVSRISTLQLEWTVESRAV